MFRADDDVIIVSTNTAVNSVSLLILGEPIAQPRTKCYSPPSTRSGHQWRVIIFDPAKDEKCAFKYTVGLALEEMGMSFPIVEDGAKLKVTAAFNVVDVRKDVDNLAKFLLDALHSVVFHNDNMVVSLHQNHDKRQ